MSLRRLLLLLALTLPLAGCFTAYVLVTGPYESVVRNKPDLYYSFALTVNAEGRSRTFRASILCRHRIGFSAAVGWWDSYTTTVKNLTFREPDGSDWQVHGISCPRKEAKVLGVYQRGRDGRVRYLDWLEHDDASFNLVWSMEKKPRHPVFEAASTLWPGRSWAATPLYLVQGLASVPFALSGLQKPTVIGSADVGCDSQQAYLRRASLGSWLRSESVGYMRRGALARSADGATWVPGPPGVGNRFIDVIEPPATPSRHGYDACLPIAIGAHRATLREGDFFYIPAEQLLVELVRDSESNRHRSLYVAALQSCPPKVPPEALNAIAPYPDFHEVRQTWREEVPRSDGTAYLVDRQVLLMKVGGETRCIHWARRLLDGSGW